METLSSKRQSKPSRYLNCDKNNPQKQIIAKGIVLFDTSQLD